MMKVLDYLVDVPTDVSLSDICDGTKLSRKTVEKIILDLQNLYMVKVTRLIGRSVMLELDKTNMVVKKFNDLNIAVLMVQEKKLQKKEKKSKPQLERCPVCKGNKGWGNYPPMNNGDWTECTTCEGKGEC